MSNAKPGIRERFYLDGLLFLRGVADPKYSVANIETADVIRDGQAQVTQLRGWESDTEAAPLLIRKWRFAFGYRLGAESDFFDQTDLDQEYLQLQRIAGGSGVRDFCNFRPIVEFFDGSVLKSFRLSAGIAVDQNGVMGAAPSVLPSMGSQLHYPAADYSTVISTANGTTIIPSGDVTWDATRDANGRQGFTLALNHSIVKVVYVPVFSVRRISVSQRFVNPHMEYAMLELETT